MTRSRQLRQLAVQLAPLSSRPSRAAVPSGSRPLGSSRRSQQWSKLCLPCLCGLDPARALLCPRPPPVLVAPFCSASVGPQDCPSRAAPRLLLTARSPPTAGPAPRGRQAWPAPPPCPSLAPWLLIPVRLLPSRLVEVALEGPPRHGDANGTSTAGETEATPNVRSGARFSVKFSPVLQWGFERRLFFR